MKRHITLSSLLILSACDSSPSQNILGSYFPAWMLCAFIGILLTVIAYRIFVKMGIEESIPAKLLIYPSLACSITFITWLIWFGN